MPDLMWDDVSELFVSDGSLLDAYVFDTKVADWQAFVDLVRSRGWRFDYLEDNCSSRLPDRVEVVFERHREMSVLLRISLVPEVRVTVHFFVVEEIEVDFSPDELQGQNGLDAVCGFLRAVGRQLGKPMVLTPENGPDHPLLGYDIAADCVVRIAS